MSADTAWLPRVGWFLSGQAVSLLGSSIVAYAIVWHVALATHDAVSFAVVAFAATVPQGLMSLVGGVWADRYSRKALVIGADVVVALVTVGLAVALLSGYESIWLITAALVLRGMSGGVQVPAVAAILPSITPREHLLRVNSVFGSVNAAVLLVVPAVAALVLVVWQMGWILLVDVVTAAIAVAILAAIKIPATPKAPESGEDGSSASPGGGDGGDGSSVSPGGGDSGDGSSVLLGPAPLAQLRETAGTVPTVSAPAAQLRETAGTVPTVSVVSADKGGGMGVAWRFVLGHPGLRRTGWLVLVMYGLIMPTASLAPIVVVQLFGDSTVLLAAVEIAYMGAFIVGGLVLAAWGGMKNRMTLMLVVTAAWAAFTVAQGVAPWALLYVVLWVPWGLVGPGLITVSTTVMQEETPPHLVGRVMGLLQLVGLLVMPVVLLAIAPVVTVVGPRVVLVVSGVAALVATAVLARGAPLLLAPQKTE
ncbi:MAG: MFS transporter [Micrococcales bacterium]|nr:MFS transporter [Micrococcales bacterium]MCL2667841.1 MFS transporter [Micrococcales bacterium]